MAVAKILARRARLDQSQKSVPALEKTRAKPEAR